MKVIEALHFVILASTGVSCGPHEKALLKYLFDPARLDSHEILERPVINDLAPVKVFMKITLQQIIDVDEKAQILNLNIWSNLKWHDYHFQWDSQKFGNITQINIAPDRIWRPDILMYNSADDRFDGTYPTNMVVSSNGNIMYIPPGMFKSTCKINIRWFPFDVQVCDLKFGSWSYDGGGIDLRLQCPEGVPPPPNCTIQGDVDTSDFILNGEWNLMGLKGKRNEKFYECCKYPYLDITFSLYIRRRKLYYIFNFIVPCLALSMLCVLNFCIPPDSGEKISFGVTILLSLTVFLLMVAAVMPPTSDAVPLIGVYFASIMLMCSASVIFTVVVLNYHHRGADSEPLPEWVKILVCKYLARSLFMWQPLSTDELNNDENDHDTLLNEFADVRQKPSKSLLANVLAMNDDLRSDKFCLQHRLVYANSTQPSSHNGTVPSGITGTGCNARRELLKITECLTKITKKMKEQEAEDALSADWRYAARVVDRFCLLFFTLFFLASTSGILLSAPDVMK